MVLEEVLRWISGFLFDRYQHVMIAGIESNWAPVLSGVPQGSVLAPVLFICYINDMPKIGLPENCKTPQDAARRRKTPQTVAKHRQTPQTR